MIETGNNWPINEIDSLSDIEKFLSNLKAKRWVFRGQKTHNKLLAPIDRGDLAGIDRIQKLWLEDQCIKQFVGTVKSYFDEVERKILNINPENERILIENRIPILMLMQHYNLPTRLLDWSTDPNVAIYFAVTNNYGDYDNEDGEVWCFDEPNYEKLGSEQWPKNPEVYDAAGKFDLTIPTLFTKSGPSGEWIVLQELLEKFPRMENQKGYFTVTSHFDVDHAIAIQRLFENKTENYCRFLINKKLKSKIRDYLKERRICQGTLFPDVAGVANALRKDIFGFDY